MMQANEIMTRNVVTIRGSATVADAVKLMKDKHLRGLVVEPRHEQDPYGIVTETDIVYKVAAFGHDPKAMRVYEIMVKPCVTVNPELGVEVCGSVICSNPHSPSACDSGQNLAGHYFRR
jgi:CBS domain-containing protein